MKLEVSSPQERITMNVTYVNEGFSILKPYKPYIIVTRSDDRGPIRKRPDNVTISYAVFIPEGAFPNHNAPVKCVSDECSKNTWNDRNGKYNVWDINLSGGATGGKARILHGEIQYTSAEMGQGMHFQLRIRTDKLPETAGSTTTEYEEADDTP